MIQKISGIYGELGGGHGSIKLSSFGWGSSQYKKNNSRKLVGFETALPFILDLLVKNKPLAAISLLYGLI